jgi:hypothetical protein
MPSYLTTLNMKAGILTKAMPGSTFLRLITLIGIATPVSYNGNTWWSARRDHLNLDGPKAEKHHNVTLRDI